MRMAQKSAEAIVAGMPLETWAERRAEEPREGHRPAIRSPFGEKTDETKRALQLRQPPASAEGDPEVESSSGWPPVSAQSKRTRKGATDEAQ